MKNRKSVLILVAILATVAILVTPVLAQPGKGSAFNRISDPEAAPAVPTGTELTGAHIVQLDDPPVASYNGGIPGFEGTSPQVTGDRKLDLDSPAVRAYEQYLVGQQAEMVDAINAALGRSVNIRHQYVYALNGMTLDIDADEAAIVAALPGVALVEAEMIAYPDTDVGPTWIGAPDIWAGNTTSGLDTFGEGIIVGVLDTGINSTHPSFADIGGDGYDHTNPYGAGVYVGVCDPGDPSYDPTFACNDKLIGAWSFVSEATTPEDSNGHGSHTASTAAGNIITQTMTAATGVAITDTISGVAPHANVIAYDVCSTGCPTGSIIAGVDQGVLDGVDVLNYSISGGGDPWISSIEQAFLGAYNAGIFAAQSAGNNGPGAGTTAKNAPWTIHVAASTHNRKMLNNVANMTGGDTTPPADILGQGFTFGYGPASIVYAGDYPSGQTATPELCGVGALGDFQSPWPPGTFSGEIVVCDRGTFGRVEKGANVLFSGAGGYILADNGSGIVLDEHVLPGTHISQADGAVLKAWLASGAGHMATLTGATLDYSPSNGDVMAGFSSRGPGLFDMIEPSITAPGVGIWAAYCKNCTNSTPDSAFISGTSMSSPHTAGAGALMMALHPDWSPSEIKSALMTTALPWQNVLKEDGATQADPFDVGSGRVDLSAAAYAGFVLHETGANFLAADPGSGGEPRDLNLASLADTTCNNCSWTRTISSTLPMTVSWTTSVDNPAGVLLSVSPSSFDLGPFESKVVTVTADTSGAGTGSWLFGNVYFTPTPPAEGVTPVSEAHFPVALIAVDQVPPDIDVNPASLSFQLEANAQDSADLTIDNLGDEDLIWTIFEDNDAPVGGGWSDNFDSYATGASLHGMGGWKGWNNNPAFTAFTSDSQALSAPNSVDINGNTDPVREFSGYDSGVWIFTAYQYIPSSFSGTSYLILLNQYDDAGATNNWSVQVNFDAASGNIVNDGNSGGTGTFLTDQWVEIRVEIDLDADTQAFFYNNTLLYQGSWSDEVSGGGITSIGALNLFANNASTVYYDDLSLQQGALTCSAPDDIPWASVSPTGGTTPGSGSDTVTVSVDSTGIDGGSYSGNLCITSNDPDESLVIVPVNLEVGSLAYLPIMTRVTDPGPGKIQVTPSSLSSTQATNTQVNKTLMIKNIGFDTLNWSIYEDNSTAAAPSISTLGLDAIPGLTLDRNATDTSPTNLPAFESGTLLWDQTDNPGGSHAPSQNFTDFGATGQAADDFVVPAGGWTLDRVFIDGLYAAGGIGGQGGPAANFDVFFYADNSGAPGAVVASETALVATSDVQGDVTLDLTSPVPLPAGTYWVSVYANHPFNPGSEQYFWRTRTVQTGSPYHWQDPANLFGTGCTSWMPGASVCGVGGGVAPDLIFQLYGSVGAAVTCDVAENIPWLSASPTNGALAPGATANVTVTFNSSGLGSGTYNAALCVISDDPLNPLVPVPVTLTVP